MVAREALDGYLFILPWLLGFVIWTAGPMLASLLLSFMRWNLFTAPSWVGLDNIKQLFTNRLVGISLWNTAYYTFLSVPLRLVTSLVLALLCVQEMRARAWFRTFFYLPSITPAVAMAIVWFWILNPEVGLANTFLKAIGLQPSQWIWHPKTSKSTFVLMQLWGAGGNTMVIFLAGLQNIPQSLYEAAQIDGASGWAQFKNVTVPMLSPVILFNLVMGIIGSFQVFTGAFLMTGGGPINSTLFTVLYLYRLAFEQFNMGYASAVAWVLFLVILIFTLIQLRTSEAWVYYEGG
jgi:multiple sugar transport system permease protein